MGIPREFWNFLPREERGEKTHRFHWHVLGGGLHYVQSKGVIPSPKPPRQVTVEVCVVIVTLAAGQDFGIEWLARWSPGRADLAVGSVQAGAGTLSISAGAFEAALVSAVREGATTVVSRPSVGAELGEKARIASGREVGVVSTDSLNGNVVSSVEFKSVSLSIEATVFQSGDAFRLLLVQRNDELAGATVVEGRSVPEIATQSLETSLMLNPGRWASGGSVLVERDSKTAGGFRWLPSSRSSRSQDRQEIGVFVRVLDGLLAKPVGSPALRAEPVPSPAPLLRAEPVKRRLFKSLK